MSDHNDGLARLPRRTFTGAALAMLAAPLASAKATATAMDAAPAAPRNRPRLIAPGGPVRVEGLDELVGEIHLACPVGARSPTTLRLIDVDRGETFEAFDEAALKRRLARIDDDRVVVHVELRSRPGRPFPIRLRPVVAWDSTSDAEGEGEMHVVATQGATVFGPPLRGGLWVAIHDPAWERGHRRVGFQQADRRTIPGRHAIDFVQVDADGRIARGDTDRPGNHFGYGAPVLAVADGIVSAARNDMAEAPSIAANRRHPLIDAPGNHVILSLVGRGHVLYEHLRPGSLTVRPGDRVRKGQVLGELGFTGDSTGPHLHLHLCDEGTPNAGEGLPFVFERFERLGGYDDLATLGRARWQAAPEGIATVRLREKPASHRVIRFAAA